MGGPPIDGGIVLVTGASSGIGRELARGFAPRARALVLVARRVDRLETLRGELEARHPRLAVHVAGCDLTRDDEIEAVLGWVSERVGTVDVLVNNAGVGDQSLYEISEWERVRRMIRTNVEAVALLTLRLVAPMVERGRGGVLNIGSGAGLALIPGAAAYVGTKHFVDGFSETLRLELDDTGVVLTQVCPGPVETEFDEAAGMEGPKGGPPEFLTINAEQCAREAMRGFERGDALVFPGFPYRAIMRLQALIPRSLQRRVGRNAALRLRRASR